MGLNKTLSMIGLAAVTLFAFGALDGCSTTSTKSTETFNGAKSTDIRKSLDEADLKGVSVSHDSSKGVVTLGGQVELERDKADAESIAKSASGGQVVLNQIAVMGAGHMGNHSRGRMGHRDGGGMTEPHR